jgi:hypothetical protein
VHILILLYLVVHDTSHHQDWTCYACMALKLQHSLASQVRTHLLLIATPASYAGPLLPHPDGRPPPQPGRST